MSDMETLDWRRRKTPISLGALLKSNQRRRRRTGRPYDRLLLTRAQMEELLDLFVVQVKAPPPKPDPSGRIRWGSLLIEARDVANR